jgi:thiamine biosynthesis protein ThiI
MNRVANRVAARERAGALVTGESVGQVASQTLPNIRAIEETAELPVLQPLCGLSKPEIVERARRIGTYEISIQPHPDCCTLFQPERPETRARLEAVHRAETALPVDDLVARCAEGVEVTDYGPEYYPAAWGA